MFTSDEIAEFNPDAITCDGFDDAIIGMAERMNLGPVVAYSIEKMIDIMITRDGMTYEEAMEWYNYNIYRSWMGEHTPVYLHTEI